MLARRVKNRLIDLVNHYPAVGLLGPRQVGKTTLALDIAGQRPSIYLDLESVTDLARITDPDAYFADHENDLVVLDEVHRAPEIFRTLRGIIDRGRRRGKKAGRFLLLGSAAIDLLKQSGETLRIFSIFERGATQPGGMPRRSNAAVIVPVTTK